MQLLKDYFYHHRPTPECSISQHASAPLALGLGFFHWEQFGWAKGRCTAPQCSSISSNALSTEKCCFLEYCSASNFIWLLLRLLQLNTFCLMIRCLSSTIRWLGQRFCWPVGTCPYGSFSHLPFRCAGQHFPVHLPIEQLLKSLCWMAMVHCFSCKVALPVPSASSPSFRRNTRCSPLSSSLAAIFALTHAPESSSAQHPPPPPLI